MRRGDALRNIRALQDTCREQVGRARAHAGLWKRLGELDTFASTSFCHLTDVLSAFTDRTWCEWHSSRPAHATPHHIRREGRNKED